MSFILVRRQNHKLFLELLWNLKGLSIKKIQKRSFYKSEVGMNAKRPQEGMMDTIWKQSTLVAERLQARYLCNCGGTKMG